MFAPCSANVRATSSSRRAVPGVDRDLDEEARRGAAFPLDRCEALGVPLQGLDVRAVLAVDGDAAPERDVPDDRVARHGVQHFARRTRTSSTPGTVIPSRSPRDRRLRPRGLRRDDGLGRDLVRLQALDDLVDDLPGMELPRAERDVEVLRLLEARSRGSPGRARSSPGASGMELCAFSAWSRSSRPSPRSPARLALVPLPDLVARPRRGDEREPVARRPTPDFEVRISTKSPLFSR